MEATPPVVADRVRSRLVVFRIPHFTHHVPVSHELLGNVRDDIVIVRYSNRVEAKARVRTHELRVADARAAKRDNRLDAEACEVRGSTSDVKC